MPAPPADGGSIAHVTGAVEQIEGINVENVTAWIGEHTEIEAPLSFSLIAGGRSNMTYTVVDAAGRKFVLRRPPMGPLLPSAHDMAREHRLMHSLRDSEVPVPIMVGLCQDEAVNERDFYVMHFLDGVVVRDIEIGETIEESARTRMCHSLIDTLVDLHNVDIDAVGLGNLAKRSGYIERQIKRWSGQWEQSKQREIPLIDKVKDTLASSIPAEARTTIAHGDYRLSNCMMDPDGPVAGVLDWELCTLGDRFAVVSGLLIYWTEPGDERQALDESPTAAGGVPTRQEMIDLYAEASGLSLDNIDYYLAFSSWRLASIIEGVNSRYVKGAMGDKDADDHQFVERINGLLASAAEYAENVP